MIAVSASPLLSCSLFMADLDAYASSHIGFLADNMIDNAEQAALRIIKAALSGELAPEAAAREMATTMSQVCFCSSSY